ncbi:MAG: type II secretion system protein [Phycisphaerales bacterium]|nr:type II secretion system GspH family protein [Phycisphaerae bacterium]NNF41631.1 type II secretion system protein [Phycisphaerales bacterium]NNM24581.1 type II secretion system protein [Phycisphaerales bacterium]
MNTTSRRRLQTGFTLIEILIVVVILGILAAIVLSLFGTSSQNAQRTAFATSGRILTDAAVRYRLDTRDYLEDAASGVLPIGFAPYIQETAWGETPIGGVWDTELNSFGVTAALGVHFDGTGETRGDLYMLGLDDMMDDGDLTSGEFRKLAADRYYFVLAD